MKESDLSCQSVGEVYVSELCANTCSYKEEANNSEGEDMSTGHSLSSWVAVVRAGRKVKMRFVEEHGTHHVSKIGLV